MLKKHVRKVQNCISPNNIQRIFQFFFKEMTSIDLVWEIYSEVYGKFVLTVCVLDLVVQFCLPIYKTDTALSLHWV